MGWGSHLIVRTVSLRNFRSYAALDLDLEPGLVLVTGPNGAGKTNLLEAVHVGAQGFSPRTRRDARLVRFGEDAARVEIAGSEGASPIATQVDVRPAQGKEVRLNGATLGSAEELRLRLSALAFTPDRLAVVKGGPLVRRAYFDRMLGRLFPARAELPADYGRTLAQRNAALRRVRAGESSREALEPWTCQVAELGAELDRRRAELIGLLAPRFQLRAESLGLAAVALGYEEKGLSVEDLTARLAKDIERGTTSAGPHLQDVQITAGERELRGFGSQGEQRTAVLALVLAEAELVAEQRSAPPLLLLDDVFSELDEERRRELVTGLPPGAQTVVTATEERVYPAGAPTPTVLVAVRRSAAVSLASVA